MEVRNDRNGKTDKEAVMAYDISEAKDLVIRAGKELLESGLIARTWGNISARISDHQFVISPSGLAYDSLTPDDIVTVNIEDGSYVGNVKPSSEKGVHAAAYRLRPDVNFVIHTHQDYATDLSVLGKTIVVPEAEADDEKTLGPIIPVAAYGLSSTRTLTRNVEKCIAQYPDSRAVLMRNHGPVCMGADYEDAFRIAHSLEKVCMNRFHNLVGGDLPPVDDPDYRLGKYSRIYHREIQEEFDEYYEIFRRQSINCVIETGAPYIRQISAFGKGIVPYVDDLAQMTGIYIRCVPEEAGKETIARALGGTCSAVLIKGKGAVCTGGSEEDAEAVLMVLDKSCQAALLEKSGRHPKAVNPLGGILENLVYTLKYSKLKG